MLYRLRRWLGLRKKYRDPLGTLRKEGLAERLGIKKAIHVGAHHGQERETYERLGIESVLWVEASPETYKILAERMADSAGRHVVVNAFASHTAGESLALHRYSNEGASSSIFDVGSFHREKWPHVVDTGLVEQVITARLDEIAARHGFTEVGLLNIDTQGAELLVLRGATALLGKAKAVIVEISTKEYYQGGALYPDVRDFLIAHGFAEAHEPPEHGDQLYLRK